MRFYAEVTATDMGSQRGDRLVFLPASREDLCVSNVTSAVAKRTASGVNAFPSSIVKKFLEMKAMFFYPSVNPGNSECI